MSTADVAAPAPAAGPVPGARAGPGPVWSWWRLLRSELALVFRRWRNLALLIVVAVLPALLAVALRLASPEGGDGPNAFLFGQLARNGVSLAFIALTIMLALELRLTVDVGTGDCVPGQANAATPPYIL